VVDTTFSQLNRIAVGCLALALAAPPATAQSAIESRPLKEYKDPPSVRPVDSVFMEEMTWLEIRNALRAGKTTVIVPAGGLEATGPFITLDKHQNMLRGSTDRIARKLGNALVAPVIRYVPEDEPAGARGPYLGDFNISLAAYKSTLADICTTLKNAGFREIILIGDHQGAQRGMKEVADELSNVGPAHIHYVASYYDRRAVNEYVKTTLGITEQRGGFGDNYYNTAILMAVNPESARLKERTEADQLTVNGVNLKPIERTIENGKTILRMQTDQTVKAIEELIAGDSAK
jgi:creatinine amidohydrolase/Fe(II)-dependent formamide hydrolase-like protein